jgi:NAD(P)H-dependent FMN reductase
MSQDIQIAVLYGSYRDNRKGIHVANFVVDELKQHCKPVLVDAKAIDLPMLNKMYKEYEHGEAPQNMSSLAKTLTDSDAFVIVTGEYNHGLPPGLKNLLDHFQKEYFFKPAGIVSYSAGSFGGVRASIHARAVLGELGMVTLSSILPFPSIGKSFSDSGILEDPKMEQRFQKFAKELLWYAEALKAKREEGTPY